MPAMVEVAVLSAEPAALVVMVMAVAATLGLLKSTMAKVAVRVVHPRAMATELIATLAETFAMTNIELNITLIPVVLMDALETAATVVQEIQAQAVMAMMVPTKLK